MPACAEKMGDKWRVVECGTRRVVRNASGTPVDGSGHGSKDAARKQAAAINATQRDA